MNLNKRPAVAIRLFSGCMRWGLFALAAVSLQGLGFGTEVGNRLENSLSFGSFRAPSQQAHRGYRSSVVENKPVSVNGSFDSEQDPVPGLDESTPLVQQDIYQTQNIPEPEPEPETGWKGYLREKGPSQVIVEIEVEQELKPLSDEVWGLIMGTGGTIDSGQPDRPGKEVVTIQKNTRTIPKTQINSNKQVVERFAEEPVKILEEEGEEESPILDDAAESYEQLMELFSRPVFATPSSDFGDADSIVSFRAPLNQPAPTVREGSRARFEIRR